MSTFNAAKTNEKKKRSTYEKFKNSVGQEEVEEEPLLVRIHYLKCDASSGWSFGPKLITHFNSSPEILRQITLFSIVKVHEARDEIPVKYYQKLQIALFCICAPLGIYANMQVKEVI